MLHNGRVVAVAREAAKEGMGGAGLSTAAGLSSAELLELPPEESVSSMFSLYDTLESLRVIGGAGLPSKGSPGLGGE
jgi:hypothetical protein